MSSLNLPNPGHFSSHFFRTNLHVELSPPQTPQRSRLISESNSLPQDTRCLIWKKIIIYICLFAESNLSLEQKNQSKRYGKNETLFNFCLTLHFPWMQTSGIVGSLKHLVPFSTSRRWGKALSFFRHTNEQWSDKGHAVFFFSVTKSFLQNVNLRLLLLSNSYGGLSCQS